MRTPQAVAGVNFHVGNRQLFPRIRIFHDYTAPDYHWLPSLQTHPIPGTRHDDCQDQHDSRSKLCSAIHKFPKAFLKI
jgi:hypothetical protein